MDNVNVFNLVVAPNWKKDLSKMATSNHSLELIENHVFVHKTLLFLK